MRQKVTSGISPRFRGLSQSPGQVTHVLLTRSPLEYPKRAFPLDLHVLSTPPAFVLSQDQTLQQKPEEKQTIPANKKPCQKPQTSQTKKGPTSTRINQTWHWHTKHPVEFSKNNHTPQHQTKQSRAAGLFMPQWRHSRHQALVPHYPNRQHRSNPGSHPNHSPSTQITVRRFPNPAGRQPRTHRTQPGTYRPRTLPHGAQGAKPGRPGRRARDPAVR